MSAEVQRLVRLAELKWPATLPIVTVHEGEGITPLASFVGSTAVHDAEIFVGNQPHSEDGRYTITVSDDQCPTCHATFSREAWIQGWTVTRGNEWHCPNCDAVDTRQEGKT